MLGGVLFGVLAQVLLWGAVRGLLEGQFGVVVQALFECW